MGILAVVPSEQEGESGSAAPAGKPPTRLPHPEERELIEGLRRGDRDALARLYDRYAEPLRRLVLAPRERDRETVLDLLHDTFVAAAESGRRFRWMGVDFFYWLRGIALNTLRSSRKQRPPEATRAIALETALPWLASEELPGDRLELAEHLAAQSRRVAAVMARLSERDRRVLDLRLVKGLDGKAAAAEMGIERAHLDVLVYRAIRRFRALWEEVGDEP